MADEMVTASTTGLPQEPDVPEPHEFEVALAEAYPDTYFLPAVAPSKSTKRGKSSDDDDDEPKRSTRAKS